MELAILGLVHEQDLHGYELRKRLSELQGSRLAVSFGSLYPALARLEADGAVKAVGARTEPVAPLSPSTGSLAGEASAFRLALRRSATARRSGRTTTGRGRPGRGKKVYGITERGTARLQELLDDPALDDRTFPLKLAFCAELPPDRRLELFERRRTQLVQTLAELTARATPPRRRRSEAFDRYLRSLREHDTASLQHDIAWLDGLIADERADVAVDPAGQHRKDTVP